MEKLKANRGISQIEDEVMQGDRIADCGPSFLLHASMRRCMHVRLWPIGRSVSRCIRRRYRRSDSWSQRHPVERRLCILVRREGLRVLSLPLVVHEEEIGSMAESHEQTDGSKARVLPNQDDVIHPVGREKTNLWLAKSYRSWFTGKQIVNDSPSWKSCW